MVMQTDLDLNDNRIRNVEEPSRGKDAVNLDYLQLTTIHKALLTIRLRDFFFKDYSDQYALALYKFDRGSSDEISMNSSSRKVTKIIDQSLNEIDGNQTNHYEQPTLSDRANKILGKRYFLLFSSDFMTSPINLNGTSGVRDFVSIFIAYKLRSYSGSSKLPLRAQWR